MRISPAVPLVLLLAAIGCGIWLGDWAARPGVYASAFVGVVMVALQHGERKRWGWLSRATPKVKWLISVLVPVFISVAAAVYVSDYGISRERRELEGLLEEKVSSEAKDPIPVPVLEEDSQELREAQETLEAARIALDAGETEEALHIIEGGNGPTAKGLGENLQRAHGLFAEAQAALSEGRLDVAIKKVEEEIALRKTIGRPSAAPYQLLGRIEMQLSDWKGAEEAFRTVIEMDEDHAGAHTSLARLLYLQGRWDEAERHNDNALGIPFSQRTSELIKEARSLDAGCKSDPYACHQLGLVYFFNVGRQQNPARKYLSLGCEQGVKASCRFLRQLRPPSEQD